MGTYTPQRIDVYCTAIVRFPASYHGVLADTNVSSCEAYLIMRNIHFRVVYFSQNAERVMQWPCNYQINRLISRNWGPECTALNVLCPAWRIVLPGGNP